KNPLASDPRVGTSQYTDDIVAGLNECVEGRDRRLWCSCETYSHQCPIDVEGPKDAPEPNVELVSVDRSALTRWVALTKSVETMARRAARSWSPSNRSTKR